MEIFWQDVTFALRTLRKSPSVTLAATVSLALAVAGNTTVFSFVNAMLYRPLPYEAPEEIDFVTERQRLEPEGWIEPCSAANFLDYRERQSVFTELAAVRGRSVGVDVGDVPRIVDAAEVSIEIFDLLGVEATRGRLFQPGDAAPGRHRVAVLTHELWMERFAAREDAVGDVIHVDGLPHDIVGILGEEFDFAAAPEVRLFVPLSLESENLRRDVRDVLVLGRRRSGTSGAEARAGLQAVLDQLAREYPEANRDHVIELINLRHDYPDRTTRKLYGMFLGLLAFVLAIACVNVANLLLARSQGREREMAVRRSLGAGRGRVVRQLLTESTVLALAGGLLGLGLAFLAVELLRDFAAADFSKSILPVIDLRVLAFNLAVTVAAGLAFGTAPVVSALKIELAGALKEGGRATVGRSRRRAASALVVGEIALALVCLAGAATMIRSFLDLRFTSPGFETDHLLTVKLPLPEARHGGGGERIRRVEALMERLDGLPGVDGVTVSEVAPRSLFVERDGFTIDARPVDDGGVRPQAYQLVTSAGYFSTLGIRLLDGRLYDDTETEPVAVISDAAARRFFPDTSPLGERVTVRGRSHRVVGIVTSVRHGLAVRREPSANLYVPWRQNPSPELFLSLRTSVAESLAETLHEEIRELDRRAVAPVQTLSAYLDQFYVSIELYLMLLSGLGALAFLLAAIGIFGVLAFSVARRTQEMGIRMAVGAGRPRLLGMVVLQGLRMLALGLAFGLPVAAYLMHLISEVLGDYMPVEPSTTGIVVVVLTFTSVLASLLPAYRAAGIDPTRALRCE